MIWMMAGVVLLMSAWWVAVPDPRRRLRRLRTSTPRLAGRIVGVMQGRAGAPSLASRSLLGLLAAVLAWTLLPTGTGWAAGVVAATVIVVGGGQLPARNKSAAVVEAELGDTVELLAVCLAAGSSIRHALDVVAGVSGADTRNVLERVLGQLRMGIPEQQAWLEVGTDEVWGPVARDVARSARSGTSLVEVLHVHAEEARLMAEERALQRARTAGVRSVVPLMVCFLPAFVLVGVLPIIAGLLSGLLSS